VEGGSIGIISGKYPSDCLEEVREKPCKTAMRIANILAKI
jgi:hypothetical protein